MNSPLTNAIVSAPTQKLDPADLLDAINSAGIDFITGVPCSMLTGFMNLLVEQDRIQHLGATHEGEALALASGAWLAGKRPAVYLQNSGLGNLVNPLTSLTGPFRIPLLLLVTWRGQPGQADEPQHQQMGDITTRQLELVGIPYSILPDNRDALVSTLGGLVAGSTQKRQPAALIVRKSSFRNHPLSETARVSKTSSNVPMDLRKGGARPARASVLERLVEKLPETTALIATTGKTGRELFTIADGPRNFYLVGAMGHASALGAGVALHVDRPVAILDGDGAALMKLGNLATIGMAAPQNLLHVVLDNGAHDSTGGQPTVSPNVDFGSVALACGYRNAFRCDSLDGLENALDRASKVDGPTLLHVAISLGALKNLGRPSIFPDVAAVRFQEFLASGNRFHGDDETQSNLKAEA